MTSVSHISTTDAASGVFILHYATTRRRARFADGLTVTGFPNGVCQASLVSARSIINLRPLNRCQCWYATIRCCEMNGAKTG